MQTTTNKCPKDPTHLFKRKKIEKNFEKMFHLNFSILEFSINFGPIRTDLSGNTVWPQASGFQKLAKLTIFGIFN